MVTLATLTFPAGELMATMPVSTFSDDINELQERFAADLLNPSEGLAIGAVSTATAFINDNNRKLVMQRDFSKLTSPLSLFCSLPPPPPSCTGECAASSVMATLSWRDAPSSLPTGPLMPFTPADTQDMAQVCMCVCGG